MSSDPVVQQQEVVKPMLNPNKPTCPLKHFTWVIPSILAGTAAPSTAEDFDFIAKHFTSIITLTEEPLLRLVAKISISDNDDAPEEGQNVINKNLRKMYHVPLMDRTTPTDDDFDQMYKIATDPSNWPMLAHCRAGIGRTAYFLCATFVALWLCQDNPGEGAAIEINLHKLVPAPLTAARLVSYIKQTREINVDEKTLDLLISRWKLALWWRNNKNHSHQRLSSATTLLGGDAGGVFSPQLLKLAAAGFRFGDPFQSNQGGASPSLLLDEPLPQLEQFRQVVRGVVGASAFPQPSQLSGKKLFTALETAYEGSTFRCILNVETQSLARDQLDALAGEGIVVRDVPITAGCAPSLAQCEEIGEIFLDKRNWPILVVCGGGRGRTGCVIVIGVAALRAAREPRVAAIGKSTNDLYQYIRSHLGPFAVENVDQEKMVHRFVHYLQLNNYNAVLPGVLFYCASFDQVLSRPTSHWLAIERTSGGKFSSVISIASAARLLSRETTDFLRNEKGCYVEHFVVDEGQVPSSTSDVQRFMTFVQNPLHWPILLVTQNGFGRALTFSAAALIALRQATKSNPDVKSLLQRIVGKNNFLAEIFSFSSMSSSSISSPCTDSSKEKQGWDYLNFLEQIQDSDGSSLSPLTLPQRKFVNILVRLCDSTDSLSAATSSSSFLSSSDLSDSQLQSINGQEEIVTKVIAFGDWGAPLDDAVKQKGLESFASQVANEITRNGKPSAILSLGDNFYQDGVERRSNDPHFANWRKLFLENHPEAFRGIPWKVILGNHCCRRTYDEAGGGYKAQLAFQDIGDEENPGGVWQFRGSNPTDKPNPYYSWYHNAAEPQQQQSDHQQRSSVFFCGIDTNVAQARPRRDQPWLMSFWSKQRAWLATQLEEAKENQDCLWKVVFFHHPIYCTGAHQVEGDVLKTGLTLADGQTIAPIENLLNDAHVDLCLNGHEHENSCRIRGPSGIIHVTAGATYEWTRYGRTNPAQDLHRCDWESERGVTGFCRVTIAANEAAKTTRLLVEFVRGHDLKTIFAISKVKNIPSDELEKEKGISYKAAAEEEGAAAEVSGGLVHPSPSSRFISHAESTHIVSTSARDKLKQAIILVDHPMMLDALSGVIEQLRHVAHVFVFHNSAVAAEAAQLLLQKNVPIAAVVTNMRRAHPDSGLRFLEKMRSLANQFSLPYSLPMVMFSHTGSKTPQTSFDAGAFTVFSTNVERLQACVNATIEANRWARAALDIQLSAQSNFDSLQVHLNQGKVERTEAVEQHLALEELRFSNCMRPVPRSFGGHILSFNKQQAIFTVFAATFDKLSKNLTKVIVDEATTLGIDDGNYFIFGEAAVSYYSQVARGCKNDDTRGRTTVLDVAVQTQDVVDSLVRRITPVLQAAADVIRGYLAHAALRLLPNESSIADIVTVRRSEEREKEQKGEAFQNKEQQILTTNIELALEPIGSDVACSGDRENQSRAFSWTVVRIHVRSSADLQLFSAAQEVGGESTRFCSGLSILPPLLASKDLKDFFCHPQKEYFSYFSHRIDLLQLFMEKVVIPSL